MIKIFEKFVEFLSMVKIAFSPIIIFTIIGLACCFSVQQPIGLLLCIGLIIAGIVLGIWLAIYIHKKHGAIEFNSRISASPELDKVEKE